MTTNLVSKLYRILERRLREQGVWTTCLWAADHTVRRIAGANILSLSRITPHVHVGGQYRRHGWPKLVARGVTAVVNLRIEFDDQEAGIAPPRYLYLPTIDDDAPTLEQLEQGALFIAEEADRGGSVFVHCGAGVGRAPSVAAAYLVHTGMSPQEAWACIREARPFIRPTQVQIAQLERFAQTHG
jgi:protein tyrosine phosphatase (PTP) superfamily phosphohydrolase (DUF442 family)